ncbi:MAG: S8 family serine peptidase [Chloroflexi bacterium]|nr:S8 family serine peptidase [Chloroflexota bacterium]MBV9598025.1 S8 family serine peptidase [Chloroflexota bacterium]
MSRAGSRRWLIALLSALAAGLVFGLGAALASPPDTLALVTLQPLASEQAGQALISADGGRLVEQLKPLSVYRVAFPADVAAVDLDALRARDDLIKGADVEGEQDAQIVPDDPLYKQFQWNLRRIGMERAWDLRPDASDVIVAVLDTGVDLMHPDLRANLMTDAGYDFLDDAPSPQDDESHGTAVAGIIGALGNNHEGVTGVAWHVKILPIKALNSQGRGPDSAMVKAIMYAADNGARIINISSTGTRYSAALETAVQYAQDKGALIVAAAGNTGNGDNAVDYPAAFDGVLAVAATDPKDQLASFSQRQSYVSLAAPGVDVPSTAWAGAGRGLYASQSGTSIAAPHVSGAAAILWALRPDLSAGDIANALLNNTDKVSSSDPGYGAGILNVARAVAALRLGVASPGTDTVALQPTRPATADVPAPPPLPSEQRKWYFAEGSTRSPFDVSFALQNPNPQATVAHFLFLAADGSKPTPYDLPLPANSRLTLKASSVMPNSEFATIVTTDLPAYLERSMYFGHAGHSAAGARQASRTWYLAEGSTLPPFDTWVLVMNPNSSAAQVQMHFLREDGSVVDHTELVPPMARKSVYVNALFTTSGFATQITADQPIVVERAMYFDNDQAGHDTLATATPSQTWYMAAGASRGGFDTWVLIENPGAAPANVKVSFITDTGSVVTQPLFVLPHARNSLYTDPLMPNAAYGIRVDSDQPIVAERAVYFDNGRAGFDSAAVSAPNTEWFLPEGSTTGSFEEQLNVLNPQSQPANVQVEYRPEAGGGDPPPPQRFSVGATSRLTLDVNQQVPSANVAMRVTSDRPIVVERVSYFARSGGQGATSSTGLTR